MSSVDTAQRLNNASQVLRDQATKVQSEDGKMGKQDFMNLFMTQMSNQSPTDPMDSGQMMQQLSQLGSMEQLENLNGEMKTLNKTQNQLVSMQAMDYMDKDVLLEGEGLKVQQGQAPAVYYNLPADADQVKVVVENKDGAPIMTQQLGFAPMGQHRFSWDGKDERGVLQGDGEYKVSFVASYTGGKTESLNAFNMGRVTGVEFVNGETWLKAQGKRMQLDKVKSVQNQSARIFSGARPLGPITEIQPKAAASAEAAKAKL